MCLYYQRTVNLNLKFVCMHFSGCLYKYPLVHSKETSEADYIKQKHRTNIVEDEQILLRMSYNMHGTHA